MERQKKVFTPPFQQIAIDVVSQWSKVHQIVPIIKKKQKANTNIEWNALWKKKGMIKCIVSNLRLKECCLAIAKISYEDYSKIIPSTMFHLRRLCDQGFFTLIVYSSIVEIKKL